jgi:hypothetical protein
MPAPSQLQISNKAIARLPAKEIASIDENSLEARECRRFYPDAVGDLLAANDWSFANQRVILAPLETDRPAEWVYAYAVPSNLGGAIRVIPDWDTLGLSIPVPFPGDPYAEFWASELAKYSAPYEIQGSTLFTNAANATLDFTISDVAGVNVSQLFITALSLELAFRIAPGVNKPDREQPLFSMAELAKDRAIADDRNRQPEEYGGYLPESIAARHGVC